LYFLRKEIGGINFEETFVYKCVFLWTALATSYAGRDTVHRILEGYIADVMCVGVQTDTIVTDTQKCFSDEGTLKPRLFKGNIFASQTHDAFKKKFESISESSTQS